MSPDDEEKRKAQKLKLERELRLRREKQKMEEEDEDEEEELEEEEAERLKKLKEEQEKKELDEANRNFRWTAIAQSMQTEDEQATQKAFVIPPKFMQKVNTFMENYPDHKPFWSFDQKKGILSFKANEDGAKALFQFAKDNPEIKFKGIFQNEETAKEAFGYLVKAGMKSEEILDKFAALKIGDKEFGKDEVKDVLEKMIQKSPSPFQIPKPGQPPKPGQIY